MKCIFFVKPLSHARVPFIIEMMEPLFLAALTNAMSRKDMNPYRLSKKISLSEGHIRNVLSGRREVTPEFIDEVSGILGLDASEMKWLAKLDSIGGVEGLYELQRIAERILDNPFAGILPGGEQGRFPPDHLESQLIDEALEHGIALPDIMHELVFWDVPPSQRMKAFVDLKMQIDQIKAASRPAGNVFEFDFDPGDHPLTEEERELIARAQELRVWTTYLNEPERYDETPEQRAWVFEILAGLIEQAEKAIAKRHGAG